MSSLVLIFHCPGPSPSQHHKAEQCKSMALNKTQMFNKVVAWKREFGILLIRGSETGEMLTKCAVAQQMILQPQLRHNDCIFNALEPLCARISTGSKSGTLGLNNSDVEDNSGKRLAFYADEKEKLRAALFSWFLTDQAKLFPLKS